MNLVLDIDDFKCENIFFSDSIKNTVMNDSSFIRIIYSNKSIVLNGIYVKIVLTNEITKCRFLENSNNKKIMQFVENLEKNILDFYDSDKIHTFKIIDQLIFIISKYFNDHRWNPYQFILKISGIWETQTHIGITYKFININHL